MTSPRHLWSGEWRHESAEAAQRLAERRRSVDSPREPPVAEAPDRGPSALQRLWGAVRNVKLPQLRDRLTIPAALRSADAHRVRSAVLLGLAMLVAAGAAYAAVSALRSSGTDSPAVSQRSSVSSGRAGWLGVDTAFFPGASGAMVVNVVPGSPADTAGLEPGDVITEIDGHPIQGPADVDSALAGMHAGQQVTIGYEQGPSAYTAQVTLRSRPSGP